MVGCFCYVIIYLPLCLSFSLWEAMKSINSFQSDYCMRVKDSEKIDCYPDSPSTLKDCLARKCCWNPDASGSNIPWCYYATVPPTYKVVEVKRNTHGIKGNLVLKYGYNHFGPQYQKVDLEVMYISDEIVRVRMIKSGSNPGSSHIPLFESNNFKYKDPKYSVSINKGHFALKIVRKSTQTAVFDTTAGPFIFGDQYIQISTSVSSFSTYGLGEHSRKPKLSFNWERFTLFNSDSQRGPNRTSLYGSYPFYLSIENNGKSNGVLFLNTYPMDVILSPAPAATFYAIGGMVDFFVFLGDDPDDVVRLHNSIFGKVYVPPYWALGFHLSRFGYNGPQRIIQILTKMWQNRVPIDGQFLDIDALYKLRNYRYNSTQFKNMNEFKNLLASKNVKVIPIVDAAVAVDPDYPAYAIGKDMDIFVMYHDIESDLVGEVWPGYSVYPDYMHPNISHYLNPIVFDFYKKLPFGGLWLDMNEPSNFVDGSIYGCSNNNVDNPPYRPHVVHGKLAGKTLCMSSRHHHGQHYSIHNIYGYSHTKAISKALDNVMRKRHLLVSRSTFTGSGVYSGHWLGDDTSSWDDLRSSIYGIINSNIFGVPFVGADICGFGGNADEELCTRWSQLGAFYTFSRNHASDTSSRQDPFAFSPQHLQSVTASLRLRYGLLPYLYTLFHQVRSGEAGTVIRGLFINFPDDLETHGNSLQFMWGKSLLISPIVFPEEMSVTAYFPPGTWFNFYNGMRFTSEGAYDTLYQEGGTVSLHVYGGSIIPLQEPAENTVISKKLPYTLLVCFDDAQRAEGSLYVDDGETLLTDPSYKSLLIAFFANTNSVWNVVKSDYFMASSIIKGFLIYGKSSQPSQVFVNGVTCEFSYNVTSSVLKIDNLKLDVRVPFVVEWK